MFSSDTTQVSDGGYQISRSLRFNSADSAYLNRTPASASNQQTWTWSAWVKRSTISTLQTLFGTWSANNDASAFGIVFGGDNTISVLPWTNTIFTSTAVFRDSSAWYHIVVAFNSTQATASNRVILYVNGVNQAGTYPLAVTQNANYAVNSAQSHRIGDFPASGFNTFGGYITEVNFIDGQALTPSSFGETNAQTGVWQPKAYSGSYGTNGFYLNFSDNSNTTAATLGKDYSGNGNNWTPNNFSVTAGAGNDSLVDSPTSYGTDTGVGGTVRGNYCTFNPVLQNNFWASVNRATLTNGNLDAGTGNTAAFGTFEIPTDVKVYFEITWTDVGAISAVNLAASDRNVFELNYLNDGRKQLTGIVNSAYGASWTSGDIIGVAVDRANNTATFYKNGTSQGAISNTFPSVPIFGGVYIGGTVGCTANFGQRPFAYTAPSGYKALCTQNLPTPTIGATSTTLATSYFNPVLYTGNGSTNSITGVGFSPDLVWIKSRSAAYNNRLYDQVRGVQNVLQSNSTAAEASDGTGLTAFGTNGFTLGSSLAQNENASTFVAWNWKANGSGSSNTAGSITSTVSANTTSGFSIITWTGNATQGATIGHGLGAIPALLIFKNRSVSATEWPVKSNQLSTNSYLYLNATNASASYSFFWSADPTSSLIYLGSDNRTNGSGNSMVCYAFAEVAGYSKFGSYTGNGSADGPFVFAGMKPAYLLLKRTDSANSWIVYDTTRDTYNVAGKELLPDSSAAEATYPILDFLSNGFKLRNNAVSVNASGGTYIYMAFASAPFKFSLGR